MMALGRPDGKRGREGQKAKEETVVHERFDGVAGLIQAIGALEKSSLCKQAFRLLYLPRDSILCNPMDAYSFVSHV